MRECKEEIEQRGVATRVTRATRAIVGGTSRGNNQLYEEGSH